MSRRAFPLPAGRLDLAAEELAAQGPRPLTAEGLITSVMTRLHSRVFALQTRPPEHVPGQPPASVRLRDGSTGYYVRVPRTDDCFAAALATTVEVPIDQVPDPQIDRRLTAGETLEEIDAAAQTELANWLGQRGLRMRMFTALPVRRRRWIGVVPLMGDFQDHCLVMSHDDVLFDPAYAAGDVFVFGPEHIGYGLAFDAVQTKGNQCLLNPPD